MVSKLHQGYLTAAIMAPHVPTHACMHSPMHASTRSPSHAPSHAPSRPRACMAPCAAQVPSWSLRAMGMRKAEREQAVKVAAHGTKTTHNEELRRVLVKK